MEWYNSCKRRFSVIMRFDARSDETGSCSVTLCMSDVDRFRLPDAPEVVRDVTVAAIRCDSLLAYYLL